jgi:hypothetical protein
MARRFTEAEDGHLLEWCQLPMSMICIRIGRSPESCKARLKKLIDSGAAYHFACATISIIEYRLAATSVHSDFSMDVAHDSLTDWFEKAAKWKPVGGAQ